jgi:hypothetical protein
MRQSGNNLGGPQGGLAGPWGRQGHAEDTPVPQPRGFSRISKVSMTSPILMSL